MRYAQHINKAKGWRGHLWQGRFFSSALDEAYTCSAIRYVERNPVEAGMLAQAETYPWSSAASHCGLESRALLAQPPQALRTLSSSEWAKWLAVPETEENIGLLRRHAEKGLPCGGEDFLDGLEVLAGRSLRYRSQGRPKKG
jgi:putative transposase